MSLSLINSMKYSIGIQVFVRSTTKKFIERKTLLFEITLDTSFFDSYFYYFEKKVSIPNVSLTNVNLTIKENVCINYKNTYV